MKIINYPKEEIITQDYTPPIENIIAEDGILCSILSKLPLKDAVATSVLSTRWRHLWTHRPKLHLNASNMFDANNVCLIYPDTSPLTHKEIIELMRGKKNEFIQSVNSVLQQLQDRGRVDEFLLCYYLERKHSRHLDAWVRFAVLSKTKILSLYLHKPFHWELVGRPYDFPFHLLQSASSVEQLILSSCSLSPPCKFDGLSNLKILVLDYIDLIEEDIIRLLANCCALEELKIESSPRLMALSTPNSLSRLRRLVVKYCPELREININAANLKILYYSGNLADFILKQSSLLEDAFIHFNTESGIPTLDFYLDKLSSNLPQLPSLSFEIAGDLGVSDVLNLPRESKRFVHLTHLDCCWSVIVKMSIVQLATLLDAFPVLEEFNLDLCVDCEIDLLPENLNVLKCQLEQPTESLDILKKMLPEHPHIHLRTVGIIDFCYETWSIEIVLYLFKNAIKLESMTIEGRGLDETHRRNLSHEAPANVQLVISEMDA